MPSTDASTSGSYTPREFIAFALAMLAAFALYVPNLRLELLADDYVFISQALRHPLTSLLGTTGGETFYRPLSRQIYFTGMAHLFGADPLPYHLVNLALYLLAAALLGHLARILLRPAAAPAAVVLFAGQHAGSVLTGWACCTQDLFALVFLVAALLLQIAGRRTWSLLTLVAGLLSKETAAVLPALVVVVEWKHLRKPLREALLAGRWHMALTGAWGLLYLARFRTLSGVESGVPVLDLTFDPGAMLQGLQSSLLGLINMDEGLSIHIHLIDWARACIALVVGVGAVLLVWNSSIPELGGRLATRESGAAPRDRSHAVRTTQFLNGRALAWLGGTWVATSLPAMLLVGHRWSAYDNAMLAAGFSLLIIGTCLERRGLLLGVVAALLVTGPAADSVMGGRDESGLHSVWSLARLRRLSGFAGSLRRSARAALPSPQRGTTILLADVPTMSLVSLRGSSAIRSWYRDTSLVMTTMSEGYEPNRLRGRFLGLSCDTLMSPLQWHVQSPGFLALLASAGDTWRGERYAENAGIIGAVMAHADWASQSPVFQSATLTNLAADHFALGRPATAESLYRAAVLVDPNNAGAYRLLGAVQLARRAYRDAELSFARAVQLRPDDPVAAFGYGVALLRRDQRQGLLWLDRSLDLGLPEPDRSQAMKMAQWVRRSLLGGGLAEPAPR